MSDIPYSVKYRPKNFDDVIGQDVVVQVLANAFKNKSLHHAYVLGGKYGCGKTSCARILAAMENNDDGPTLNPNPESKNCKEIFAGTSIDVKEVDAASHRGIEDIRQISKDIRFSPTECRVKYVIIDEAHSLTGFAAEAALKMIEEPPPGVRFLLCTTDPHLLKDTIHSRCIQLKFHKVSWNLLSQHVEKIANLENIEYEPDALKIAARTADGSVRNVLQNLQTLVNYAGGKKITTEHAKEILGAVDDRLFFNLIESIIDIKTISGMQVIEGLLRDGRRAEEVINGLHQHLRNLLLTKTCSDNLSSFGFTDEDVKRYRFQAEKIKTEIVLEMMSALIETNRGLVFNLDPQILLEKFFIQMIIFKTRFDAKKIKK
jgi:DNA polymerase III subunit gamma/tau